MGRIHDRIQRAAVRIQQLMSKSAKQRRQVGLARYYYEGQICNALADNAKVRNIDWEGTGLTKLKGYRH